MRAKIFLPILGLAAFLMLAGWVARSLRPRAASGPASAALSPTPPATTLAPSVRSPYSNHPVAAISAKVTQLPAPDPDTLEKPRPEDTINQVIQLGYLATTGDSNSLATILSNLSNQDPEIRRAALAGALEFGDRSAIPALNDALQSNPDPLEKSKIQQAINYLQLPTLDEQASKDAAPTGLAGSPSGGAY